MNACKDKRFYFWTLCGSNFGGQFGQLFFEIEHRYWMEYCWGGRSKSTTNQPEIQTVPNGVLPSKKTIKVVQNLLKHIN